MVGRAGPFLAGRSLTALVVIAMVASGFAGMFIVGKTATASGDLIVTGGTTYVIQGLEQSVDGNVVVSGGTLKIIDGTLSIVSNYDQRFSITVGAGGTLVLDHGVITTHLDQLDPWAKLDLIVEDGGVLTATNESILRFPGSISLTNGAEVTLTDTLVTALPSTLVSQYVVGSSGLITLDSADDGPNITVTNSVLRLIDSSIDSMPEFASDAVPAGNLTLEGSSTLLSINSYISVDFGPALTAGSWYTHNCLVVNDESQAYLYGTHFEKYSGTLADRAPAIVVFGPSPPTGNAYVYRWLNATAGDEYGVPIPDATISAVFTGITDLEGQEAFYFTETGVSTAPDPMVLDYMGKDASDFNVTEADGTAIIPYLTDIIADEGSLNPQYVGSYEFTATAVIDSVEYSSSESHSFPVYPAMESGDQFSSLTVEVMGVSVSSPDVSRWLVVPLPDGEETLVIEDMVYYHAGDVIVASDGELIFLNGGLLMVQESDYQRAIYVDGNGRLVFENSEIYSAKPINIIVTGHGTLEVLNSTLTGFNIIAFEDAAVIMRDSSMTAGQLSTSWNSRAVLSVFDCVLASSPVLSGTSIGSFTNSSIPSIIVTGDAIARIYRWIHVTILDGNMKPLPNADVYARFFVNNTPWTSTKSDLTGIAKLNCLGTIITEEGSTYIGNYRVNATYWYGGVPYPSDQEVSVGVMPYTEPLGKNATYATLTVSSVFPDLTIATNGAVTFNPVMPLNGQATTVTAIVQNVGTSYAYNVPVWFYDENVLFAMITCPSIAPGPANAASVVATWIADPPLSPDKHTIKVVVDPNNVITELDESLAVGYGEIFVQNLPDVEIVPDPWLYTDPSDPVIDAECMIVTRLRNIGDYTAYNVPVAFYNVSLSEVAPEYLIGETTVEAIGPDPNLEVTVSVPWTPNNATTYTISVVVNGNRSMPEISYANNNASFEIQVHDYPDLALTSFSFDGVSTIAGGDDIQVRAILTNLEPAPVINPQVALYVDSTASAPYSVFTYLSMITDTSGSVTVSIKYTAPIVTDTEVFTLILVANPFGAYPEQNLANNQVSGILTVTDARPDLSVTASRINVSYGGADVDGQMFGRTVNITVDVLNLGGRLAQGVDVLFTVRPSGSTVNYTIGHLTGKEVLGGSMATFWLLWTINMTVPGDYLICVQVDTANAIPEPDETNNYAESAFEVQPLALSVEVTTDDSEYEAGSTMVVTVNVRYNGTSDPVVGVFARLALFDSADDPITVTITPVLEDDPLMTNADGMISDTILVPADLPGGSYSAGVMIQGADYLTESTFTVTGEVSGEGIPLMIWIIVILAIVGVVVGFTVYTYVYGLGKLVECGECGAFIPAASKRCPKCGVEFEVGTMKCSECGAWVPSDAGECPNCGVKFVGEPGTEDMDYLERMKAEYESMVSEYREMAKEDLGKKFSDKKFDEWWQNQPTYISFDDWLAKEEEKRKEGPMACPVCGTLNPREATVCHKCGTVFAPVDEEPPPEEGPGMPPAGEGPGPAEQQIRRPPEGGAGAAGEQPKMVIRRPIDRKVVPKKIIRAPVDKEGSDAK